MFMEKLLIPQTDIWYDQLFMIFNPPEIVVAFVVSPEKNYYKNVENYRLFYLRI